MVVYVLDINSNPLMPTTRLGKIRRLLKENKAKVVSRTPFTIKLLYEPETQEVQDCVLGIGTGSKTIGASVFCNEKILYASETEIRNDIKTKMDRRRTCRRNRRNRKTRYRKSRFLNRKNSIKKDRFNPTMVSKINSHIREIEFIKSILPINTLVLETGTFDPHKLKDPTVRGWGYQKGQNYGFVNAKEACHNRDNHTCQCCKTKKGTLHAHHIIYRSKGGADTLDNLITLCEECHKKLHKGELKKFESKLKGRKKGQLKHATQMNTIRVQLLKYYPEAIETFGYVTKQNRWNLNLGKTHYVDAAVIASGGEDFDFKCDLYLKRHVAKGDYQLSKGIRGEKKINVGKINGFRKWDKVLYMGEEYFIKGRRTSGTCELENIHKEKIDFSHMPSGLKTPKMSILIRLSVRDTTLCILGEIA